MHFLIAWLDEATLGFVNYFSWQQILWLQTAFFEPDDEPPDGGIPLFPWPRLWRGLHVPRLARAGHWAYG